MPQDLVPMRIESYLNLIEHLKDNIVSENMGGHVLLLYELVSSFDTPKVLELGTGRGGSLVPLALACKDGEGKIVTIDYSLEENQTATEKIQKFGAEDYVEFITGDDRKLDAIDKIKGFSPFNFIFIDTTKKYEQTQFELDNYSKFLSKSGFIALHDTYSDYEGVNRAITNFLEKNKNFVKIIDKSTHYGLTILKKVV